MNIFKKVSIGVLAIMFSLGLSGPTAVLAAGPTLVNLGTSGNFAILAKTGISTTGLTSINGNIGVSPISASAITGFGLTLPAASPFSTSVLVAGKVYAPDYANPTPANMTTAVLDMQTAYTDAMGRAAGVTELGAGNIGGLTLAPGVYKWGTGVTIPADVTLSGSANDVWIFQIAQTLTVSSSAHIVLSGGAQAGNVFWIVSGQTTIGTSAVFNGNILDQTAIVLNTGATLNGRALAQTAVTLDSNAVSTPSGGAANSDSGSNSISTNVISNSINAGASITSSPFVTLALSATGATEMIISNDTGFAGASWETYVASKPWVLTSGDGLKTVYAKFRDAVGDMSSVVSSTVTVSTNGTIAANSHEPIQGCSLGNIYNTSTGALCINNVGSGARVVYNFGNKDIRNGSRGNFVMELQKFLNAKLNSGLTVDGEAGPRTVIMVKKWQAQNGLVSDGVAGPKTKAKMNAEIN
jgi:hypothetical protein